MGIGKTILESFLGPLGKKAAQWIPSKEGMMRRNIAKYEQQIKDLKRLPWTPDLGREYDRLDKLLQQERKNLDSYLATDG